MPASILATFAIHYTVGAFNISYTPDNYNKEVLSLIGLSAAIGSLAMSAARSAPNEALQKMFFSAGRQLFYGTLLFSMALGMKFAFLKIDEPVLRLVLGPYKYLIQFFGIIFFYMAIFSSGKGITTLHKNLFQEFLEDIRIKH